jgi:hypothetical protein
VWAWAHKLALSYHVYTLNGSVALTAVGIRALSDGLVRPNHGFPSESVIAGLGAERHGLRKIEDRHSGKRSTLWVDLADGP